MKRIFYTGNGGVKQSKNRKRSGSSGTALPAGMQTKIWNNILQKGDAKHEKSGVF
jgi:hypothetical protein